jgi:hypothetical protein
LPTCCPLRESSTCRIESHLRTVGNPTGVKFSGGWYNHTVINNPSKYRIDEPIKQQAKGRTIRQISDLCPGTLHFGLGHEALKRSSLANR